MSRAAESGIKGAGRVMPVVCLLSLAFPGLVVGQEGRRSYQVDDMLALEDIRTDARAFSPDGGMVAFERTRRASPVRETHEPSYLDPTDIWVVATADGVPKNLTEGESDGSRSFSPVWSPNGQHLVFLSTKGGGNIRLWMWTRTSGALTQLSERGVPDSDAGSAAFAWVDDRHLAVIVLPEGEQARHLDYEWRSAKRAMHEWPKAWAGRETTASALDSGVPVDVSARPQQEIHLIDIDGKMRVLASGYRLRDLTVSADGRYVAALNDAAIMPPSDDEDLTNRLTVARPRDRARLVIADRHSQAARKQAADEEPYVVAESFRWAYAGDAFAFLGRRPSQDDNAIGVIRGRVNGPAEAIALPAGVHPDALLVLDGDRLLVRGVGSQTRPDVPETAGGVWAARPLRAGRTDWWLISAGAAPGNLTEHFREPPGDLYVAASGRAVTAVADGDVWQWTASGGQWVNHTTAIEPPIAQVLSSSWAPRESARRRYLVVATGGESDRHYHRVDLASGETMPLSWPSIPGESVGHSAAADAVTWIERDRTGTRLALATAETRKTLLSVNTFLSGIAEGERRVITYRSDDGEELKAWLLLPVGFMNGKRYPVVTFVYAGNTYDQAPSTCDVCRLDYLNKELLAARGYVVLTPSMPMPSSIEGGEAQDPMFELTKGVLPAVDKVIDLGIGDPTRLAVMGHSFGGYSTYGLVALTNRFQAAIAEAAAADLISGYGNFDPLNQYFMNAAEDNGNPLDSEVGQRHLGNPPWKDWGRYVRNSPFFYIDRVQTPLLIVKGDWDFYGPMAQTETLFSALYRQGKRARLLRYWGEAHTIKSPANIRDYWHQVYAWIDEHCDITRDGQGRLVFDRARVKSRGGAPPLTPADFARFDQATAAHLQP